MTDASEPAGVDYARAIAEASAFLARGGDASASVAPGRWAHWAALPASADVRYPMPALDPARR